MIVMEVMMEKDSNHLVTIYRVMNMQVFGYRVSAKIVGGRARLDDLIMKGHIRAEKVCDKQNGKIRCNASDVLRYASA